MYVEHGTRGIQNVVSSYYLDIPFIVHSFFLIEAYSICMKGVSLNGTCKIAYRTSDTQYIEFDSLKLVTYLYLSNHHTVRFDWLK